jgi:hypothetical protein
MEFFMGSGATKNYRFGQKNIWRRWQWNRVVRILRDNGKKPKDAVVLYMPGANDLDWRVARKHGFRRHNMIGVEIDKRVASSLRSRGINVINAPFEGVLNCWSGDPPLDVILGDFCGGLTRSRGSSLCMGLINVSAATGVAVVLNFLRGRDGKDGALIGGLSGNLYKGSDDCALRGLDKHRGIGFYLVLREALNRKTGIKETPQYSINSYKSGNLYMDSVAIKFDNHGIGNDRLKIPSGRKLVSAAKAIRTMRLAP